MNVYYFKLKEGGYRGGCAIVAARSEYEAYGVLIHKEHMAVEYFTPERCECIPDLVYNGTEPQVITLDYYVE